jgi:hypothetical protein
MDQISEEILVYIFSFLDERDLLACGRVSHSFRRISFDEQLWRRLAEQHFPTALEDFQESKELTHVVDQPIQVRPSYRALYQRWASTRRNYRQGKQRAIVLEGHSNVVTTFQVMEVNGCLHVVSGSKDG